MSRPDLYDLATSNGGMKLIPRDLCQERRIGVDRVWSVLVHRLLHADSASVTYWSTSRLADELGLDRRDVRLADEVLLAGELMQRDV